MMYEGQRISLSNRLMTASDLRNSMRFYDLEINDGW